MLIKNQGLRLLNDHALLIERDGSVLVTADLHLGKSAVFRAHGLPVPEGDTERDLARLSAIIEKHQPERVVVAGDLFHAASGQTEEVIGAFQLFIERIGIPFVLVIGNHDRKIKKLPQEIEQVKRLDIDGIRIVHDPEDSSPERFHICGHIHPVVRIPDGRKTSLRLPCFHLRRNVLTLPSFGSFTGGQVIKPESSDRIFVSHMGEIIEVPPKLL